MAGAKVLCRLQALEAADSLIHQLDLRGGVQREKHESDIRMKLTNKKRMSQEHYQQSAKS